MRTAPRDYDYAPSRAESFIAADFATTDIDLTARDGAEFPYAATELYVASVTAPGAGEEALVVTFQARPTTDVVIRIPPGQTITVRGAVVKVKATNTVPTGTAASLRITAFWPGGPT